MLVIHHTAIKGEVQGELLEKAHKGEGYPKSNFGGHICYHFLVGKDGTVKQTRGLQERSGCTRNSVLNLESIHIVVAGNFQEEKPTRPQLAALRSLIHSLDSIYHFEEVIPHHGASPTACAGKHLEEALSDVWREKEKWEVWNITRYYTPVRGQLRYFRKTYEEDFVVNCHGDCLSTANSYKLKKSDAFKIAACPPGIAFGTRIEIEGIGVVTCQDRGGAIKNKRLDVWAGIGEEALLNLTKYPAGYLRIRFLDSPK